MNFKASLYKIPEFNECLIELQNDPNCHKIQINLIDLFPGLRLYYPGLKFNIDDLDKLSNCEILALSLTINRITDFIYRNIKNIE
jgi:hypothetical protein